MLNLGLIGDEFKTARTHLLGNLEGNIAWKDPAQAVAQKERFRQQREQELREQAQNSQAQEMASHDDMEPEPEMTMSMGM